MLAECVFPWTYGAVHEFALTAHDNGIEASIDGAMLFAIKDAERPLNGGGVALVVEEGRIMCDAVTVSPPSPLASRLE